MLLMTEYVTLLLVYRKQFMHRQEFFRVLEYLLATHSKDSIVGYFNYDLLKVINFKSNQLNF